MEAICDTAAIETEMDALAEECSVAAELIRKCVEENAHISIQPEVYAEKYNALVKRYETAKSKYDALQENLSERAAKRERIEIYLKELSRAENLVTAFDDGLWNTMVDTLTIYSKERFVFRFRDGSEIEWSIR